MTASSRPTGLPSQGLLFLLAAQLATAQQPLPTAIRKMGFDPGEKFFPEYYAFGGGDQQPDQVLANNSSSSSSSSSSTVNQALPAQRDGVLTEEEEALLAINASAAIPYRAPFAAHFSSSSSVSGGDGGGAVEARGDAAADEGRSGWGTLFSRNRARSLVAVEAKLAGAKRDFTCPTGTSSCSSIGYPDSCCQAGTTCVQIDDTGLGPVGCCPDGESCAGTIACSDGQQGCSSESGGGCCIPGYACASVGCK